MNNSVQRKLRMSSVRFTLLPEFEGEKLDLSNDHIFVQADQRYKVGVVSFPQVNNHYLDNELRGFIQYLAVTEKLKSSTIREYFTILLLPISRFFNQYYNGITSITDIEYGVLYAKYIEYLTDAGYKIMSSQLTRVSESMEWKTYYAKSQYLLKFGKMYKFISDVDSLDTQTEFDKDIWDIRNLGISYDIAICRRRYTVNFTLIKQTWLKKHVKEYIKYRIQCRTLSSVLDDMKALNLFSEFLYLEHPEVKKLSQVTRFTIEEYFTFVSSKGFVTTTYNRRLSGLKTFLALGNMLDLPDLPVKPLISNSDFRKTVKVMPRYFTENELSQMNAHIAELPIQTARMFFVLENCGMRVSDICSSPIMPNGKYCLSKIDENSYIFTYYMPKTHKYNSIPISEIVGCIIEEAIVDSRKKYGENCVYIFASSEISPISTETFSLHMNLMSKKNGLTKDDGTPLRIKGHTFRGTVATKYANSGIGMDVIRLMLGQQKIGVLKHYITIHEDTMLDYLKPITDESNDMILNIGKLSIEDSVNDLPTEPALIPLSNGRCSKDIASGVCSHANHCYSCQMFRPLKCCLPLYKSQLNEAESNIAIAELHGYDRILELNSKLRDDLIKVISKLESENTSIEQEESK